jgi:hypothetical protein
MKYNWRILLGALLFSAALYWKYGPWAAPRAFLGISYRYILSVYTLMVVPFAVGCFGFRKMRNYVAAAVAVPLSIAIIYQLVYGENILRLWYQGEFDRHYILGLAKALVVLPALFFVLGLLLRKRS